MAKVYTIKIYYKDNLLERFDNRNAYKLIEILNNPRYHKAGQLGPWGEIEKHPDRFEIYNSYMEKLSSNDIQETLNFLSNLR